jgi:hypothetical protein
MKKSIFLAIGIGLILTHLLVLSSTQFIDWPELLLYPFLIAHGFTLYTKLLIPYQPLPLFMLVGFFKLTGFSVQSLRLFQLVWIIITDLVFSITVFKLTSSHKITLLGLGLYILLAPAAEGNGLWFDMLALPFLLVGIFSTIRLITQKPVITRSSTGMFIIATGSLGVALLTKQTMAWTLVPLTIFALYFSLKKDRRGLLLMVLIIATLLFPLLQLFWYLTHGQLKPYLFWIYQFGFSLKNNPDYVIPINIGGDYPFILLGLLSVILGIIALKNAKQKTSLVLLLIWTVCSYLPLFPRWTLTHLQSGLLSSVLLISLAVNSLLQQPKNVKRIGTVILCVIILIAFKINLGFIKNNFGKPNRFYTSAAQRQMTEIKTITQGRSYYLAGVPETYYVYLDKIPEVSPFIQWFPWNFEIANVEESQIKALEDKKIQYIFTSPYHPQNSWYDDKEPVFFEKYLEEKFTHSKTLTSDLQIYQRK